MDLKGLGRAGLDSFWGNLEAGRFPAIRGRNGAAGPGGEIGQGSGWAAAARRPGEGVFGLCFSKPNGGLLHASRHERYLSGDESGGIWLSPNGGRVN